MTQSLATPTPARNAFGLAVLAAALAVTPCAEAQTGLKWAFDGELSQSAVWRASGRDRSLIGPSNGGTDLSDLSDDGNLNYRRGDLVMAPSTLLATLEAEYGNHRALVRGSLLYDWEVMDQWRHRGADPNPGRLRDEVKDRVGRRARLLDAFVASTFRFGDKSLETKLGRQVILWGEAKFLPGGINMLNPIDITKTHAPGVSLKEIILPVGAAAATFRATSNLTLQGFYQLERAKTEFDPVGTFFSDVDIIGEGAGDVLIVPGAPPLLRARSADRNAKRAGQYGLAAFVNLPDVGVGLGFYYQNLHQRTQKVNGLGLNGATSYFWDFPEDIKTYGVSFNTGIGSASVWGEIAYRDDVPVSLDPNEVGAARVGAALCGAVLGAPATCGVNFAAAPFFIPVPPLSSTTLRADANGVVEGWTRSDQLAFNLGANWAFTGSTPFVRVLGGDGGSLFLETMAMRTDPRDVAFQVRDKWHGSAFALLAVDYLRVMGSNWSVTPRLVLQTWFLGDDPSGGPFFKGRWHVSPAIQIRRENPDISFELSYTNITDTSGSRPDRVLSDRDYVAATLRWAF